MLNTSSTKIRLLSLFSGCGGMDIGFEGQFTCLKKSINTSLHSEWIAEENNCTPEEVEHFRALGQIYDKGRNSRMYNAEYRKESAPYFAQLSAARISEAEHQAALDASDYKNNKHAQGLIDDIEYAEFTVECNAHRDAINIAREEQKTALAEITTIKKKFKLGRKSIKKCFLEAYTLDMEFYHKNHPTTEVAE